MQLKGHAARGFAFDKFYGMDDSSDRIFAEVVEALVDNIFKVRARPRRIEHADAVPCAPCWAMRALREAAALLHERGLCLGPSCEGGHQMV